MEREKKIDHIFFWEFFFFFLNLLGMIAGDVLLHCVVDAILGALGLPDIGQIFPDTDPKWKGAPSSVFIKEAVSCYFFRSNYQILYEFCFFFFFDAFGYGCEIPCACVVEAHLYHIKIILELINDYLLCMHQCWGKQAFEFVVTISVRRLYKTICWSYATVTFLFGCIWWHLRLHMRVFLTF